MGALGDMLAQPPRREPKAKAPAGWEPGLTWDGTAGTIITPPLDTEPDPAVWAELVADWGLDPERHQIVPGSLQFRGWDAPVGDGEVRRLRYYRATIVDRLVRSADVDELCAMARRKKPVKPVQRKTDGNPWLVVSLNDWQIGKGEGGGTPATVEAITAAFDGVRRKLRELTKLGRRPARVLLANTGDLTERNAGHYASQAYTTDLNDREQQKVARHLLWMIVDGLVTDGYGVTVTAVPCNHGENRNGDRRAQTTPDDNVSLTLVEAIEEACRANPDRYRDVDFAYAKDLTMVMDVAGVNVGLTHGHQIPGTTTNQKKPTAAKGAAVVQSWWIGQMAGREPIAAADMLLTAHRHHLQVSEEIGRPVILAPALDGGSYWYTSATGRSSPRGMLTLTVGDAHHRGWGDLEVIG